MGANPRLLFFADCGAEIGGGHVMRMLTLAEAAAANGASCAFAAPPEAAAILAAFGSGIVEALPAVGGDPDAAVRSAGDLARAWRADWLVVDHYRLERRHEAGLRGAGARIAVVDDLAERPRDCDLLLDPSYGRTASDYANLVPGGAVVLTGPQFALVRPQFAQARPVALARRGAGPVRRGLVSLGLTDVGGVTARVVEALLPHLGEAVLDVALGRGAPSLERLQALGDPRLVLHVEAKDMAGLMVRADLAVGAGGSSTWERCCLGLPTVTVVLAPNQAPLAAAFARDGVSAAAEVGEVGAAWAALAADGEARFRLGMAGAALCDGLGAGRVAKALLEA